MKESRFAAVAAEERKSPRENEQDIHLKFTNITTLHTIKGTPESYNNRMYLGPIQALKSTLTRDFKRAALTDSLTDSGDISETYAQFVNKERAMDLWVCRDCGAQWPAMRCVMCPACTSRRLATFDPDKMMDDYGNCRKQSSDQGVNWHYSRQRNMRQNFNRRLPDLDE